MPGKVIKIRDVGFHEGQQRRLKKEYQVKPDKIGVAIKGDGHGNWRNILLDAEMQGMVTLNDGKRKYFNLFYNRLVNDLNSDEISAFIKIINSLSFTKNITYTLLGDLLADRGQCDFFMLLLIHKMKQDGVDLTIILSNHDLEFLRIFSLGFPDKKISDRAEENNNPPRGFYDTLISKNDQDASLQALGYLLNKNLITKKELNELIPTYLNCLKLIDYKLSKDGRSIALISHAPCSVEHYKSVAEYLGIVNFDDSTPEKLARSIDAINKKYSDLLKENDQRALNAQSSDNPLHPLIWSRWNDDKKDNPQKYNAKLESFKPKHKNYSVFYIHGHDGSACVPDDKKSFVRSLDSDFAKKGINELGEITLFSWDGDTLEFQDVAEKEAIESNDALKKPAEPPKQPDLKPEEKTEKKNLLKKPEKPAKTPDSKLAKAAEKSRKKTAEEIALSDKSSLKNPTQEEINKRLQNLTALVSKNAQKYEVIKTEDNSSPDAPHLKTILVKKPQPDAADSAAKDETKYVACGTFTYNALTNSSATDPAQAAPEVYDGMLDALDLEGKTVVFVTATNEVGLDSLKQAFMQTIKKGFVPRLSQKTAEKPTIDEKAIIAALETEANGDDNFKGLLIHYKSQITPMDDVSKKLSTLGFLPDSDKTNKTPESPISVDDLKMPLEI